MVRFKARKDKIILIVLTVLILLVGIFLFSGMGYIPLIGRVKAENKLSAYVQKQGYRADRLYVKYDWYNNVYVCRLDDKTLLSYRLQNNSIHDEKINKQVNEQLQQSHQDIVSQFPTNLIFPESIFLWSTVKADNYTEKAERLYLLGVFNTADLPVSESEKMPAAIATDFIARMGDEYNITGIQLIYADRNGMYDIEIRADSFRPLEEGQLLVATKKRPEERLPEDYLEWRQDMD